MARKDLLELASLSREEIDRILDEAVPFKELFTRSVKKVPALKGKSVLMLFYEPSTRTHSSFEVAAKRLSADVIDLDAFVAGLDASSIGDGYKLKFQNTGDGQICKMADVTGDQICFNKNEFVCLEWCNGQWHWA